MKCYSFEDATSSAKAELGSQQTSCEAFLARLSPVFIIRDIMDAVS